MPNNAFTGRDCMHANFNVINVCSCGLDRSNQAVPIVDATAPLDVLKRMVSLVMVKPFLLAKFMSMQFIELPESKIADRNTLRDFRLVDCDNSTVISGSFDADPWLDCAEVDDWQFRIVGIVRLSILHGYSTPISSQMSSSSMLMW